MSRPPAYAIWSHFAPSRGSPLSIQEQLVRFFRQEVAKGALRPGTRVPASRALAQELGLARGTVSNVYERLAAEGFLVTRHGFGTIVAGQPAEPKRRDGAGARAGSQPRRDFAGSRRALELMTARSVATRATWPLTPGVPALDAFPFALWARLNARFHRRQSADDLAYGEPLGYRPLREAIAGYVGAARGITCTADEVLVTTGTQSATYIAALTIADPGERAWIEDPGYNGTRLALRLADLKSVPVRVDEEGLDVADGQRLDAQAKLVQTRLAIVSPSHQFPTGVVMSLTRRLALIDWAEAAGAYVIEDDYDSEFRYDGEPIASLKALDGRHGRVIYVGTLSKVLAPGLRLGFLIVPDHLIDAARAVRSALDRQVSLPLQATVSEFIGNGHLGAHIRKLRAVYAERRHALLEALDTLGRGLFRVSGAATGVHVLGGLPPSIDDVAVARRARARQIGVEPLSFYRVGPDTQPRPALLLGFANTPPVILRAAVADVVSIIADEPARRLVRASVSS
ncbi:transcriptional regulator, GntR family [Rhizobiales bacterium GAS191]|jgi:GntR family transcriptional regulator/MocR family aminotransferase|nr:transcriptional regulator, GntR family [Rhizobiales bacterium GAS113]SED32887.1 transcriptional regulator, GntR family [Rhizobiales bacterium GAS188]SEE96383.1 transcriptional regulator, GntR family [Rhizobiales bacterium GAS191]